MQPPDRERRNALRNRYRDEEEERRREQLCLTREQLTALRDYLEAALEEVPCDHRLTATLRWASAAGVDEAELRRGLAEFGGYCDCEVVLNVEPDEIFITRRSRG